MRERLLGAMGIKLRQAEEYPQMQSMDRKITHMGDKVEDIVESVESSKCLLDSALADGVITKEQHEILTARRVDKGKKIEKSNIQTSLIATGLIILIVMISFAFLMEFRDLDYFVIISIFILITTGLFLGSLFAKKFNYLSFHYGLLVGASNLFVFAYGYWFYYERRFYESYDGDLINSIQAANRNIALAIPLIIIPIIILCYLIHKNSRLGSQGAILSLIIGGWFTLARATYWGASYISGEAAFIIIGLIGLCIFLSSLIINLLWRNNLLSIGRAYYHHRVKTFHSLLASGYMLGSVYILFYPVITGNYYDWGFGALISLALAFLVIAYGIKTSKMGLILSACAIIIISTWIGGLSAGRAAGICLILNGILTAVILIGTAFLLRWLPKREASKTILPNNGKKIKEEFKSQ